jgi:peptidoglycan/LPS O-acetylase OafA/YrhL
LTQQALINAELERLEGGGVGSPPPPVGSGRVLAVDGLRGVAALLVVIFHLHGAISRSATGWLWAPLDWAARNGFLGVDIFFVISGYVIALTVSKGAPTPGYFGRFIVRRSIRLDPPYWSAILLEILLLYLTMRMFPGLSVKLPTTPQLLAHLVYAQELLGYGSVVNVFWTLCYEIQFYSFFVGLVVVQAMLPARWRRPLWTGLFYAVLFAFSLWTRYWRPEWLPEGLAIDRWFQFFIGALTWRVVASRGRLMTLVAAWSALAAAVLLARAAPTQLLALFVSGLLVFAAHHERWARLLAVRPLRFLGTISYSLYLYHSSVGWRFVSLAQRLIPGAWDSGVAIAVYVLGVIGSIGFATGMWWLVERPCLKLCQRVRLPLRAALPDSAPQATVVVS